MKIAGQKNNGAWSRANGFIKSLTVDQGSSDLQSDFVSGMKALASFAGFVAAIHDIMEKTGANGTVLTQLTVDSLAQTYATKGIPRYVWMGALAWDTYTKGSSNGKTVYRPDHAEAILTFGNELRAYVTAFRLAARLALDTINEVGQKFGNPGGVADDTKGT